MVEAAGGARSFPIDPTSDTAPGSEPQPSTGPAGPRAACGGGRHRSWEPWAEAAWGYWQRRQSMHAGRPGAGRGPGDPMAPPWAGPRRHGHLWRAMRRGGRIRRSRDDRMIGGVAAGVARRCHIDPTIVRLGFVLGALASGVGAAVYVVAWLVLPAEGDDSSIAARAMGDWRGIALALSFIPLIVLGLVLGAALGARWIGSLATPLFIGAGGLVLVWRNVDEEERALVERMLRPLSRLGLAGRSSWRRLVLRLLAACLLAAGGAAVLLLGSNRAVLRPLGGVFLVVAAAVVAFGPWWLHVVRDLVDERQARALAEERADMAARVHDSVLQTLALIQRRADQPQQVVRLARAQERELRSWLFEGQVPGSAPDGEATVAAAVHRIQQEVESLHEVPVEAVVVGDCPLDDDLRTLVAAGREATVNAANWSGATVV